MMASFTYMTGKLIKSTACHSAQFNGTMENNDWRKGV